MQKFHVIFLFVVGMLVCIPQTAVLAQGAGANINSGTCTGNGGSCGSCWWGQTTVGACSGGGSCCAWTDSTRDRIWDAHVRETVSDPDVQNQVLGTGGPAYLPNSGFRYELLEPLPGQESASPEFPQYVLALYNVSLMLIVIAAVLMISVGGFTWLTSAGNTARLSSAKTTVLYAALGLGAALVGWLIFRVINPELTDITLSSISPVPSTPAASVGTLPPGVSTGVAPPPASDVITAASTVQSNGRITLAGSGECRTANGTAVSPQSVIGEVVGGKAASYCNSNCKSGVACTENGVGLNLTMLNAMNKTAAQYPYQVTSITGGAHDPNSKHYKGTAIDVVPSDRSATGYYNIIEAFNKAGAVSAFCDNNGKAIDCSKTGQYNHAHVSF